MAEYDLKLKLEIKEVLNALSEMQTHLRQVFSLAEESLKITADGSQADGVFDDVRESVESLDGADLELTGDGSGAIGEADSVKEAIDGIPDTVETKHEFDSGDSLQKIANLSLAYQGITSIWGQAKSTLGSLISLSNEQEEAEIRLAETLKQNGIYSERLFDNLKDVASGIQSVTRSGDEANLKLMNLALTMGVGFDQMQGSVEGAIGLATKFRDVGLSQERAIRGIALAMQGEYTALQRYIPELMTASTEAEKMAILQRHMAEGFDLAKAEVESGSGAIDQYQNLIGDFKEILGDLLKDVMIPFINVTKPAIEFLINNKGVLYGVLASIAGGFLAIKVQAIATGIAMNGAFFGLPALIALVVGGLTALVGWLNSGKESAEVFKVQFIAVFRSIWEYIKGFAVAVKDLFFDISNAIKLALKGKFKEAFNELRNELPNPFAEAQKSANIVWNEARSQIGLIRSESEKVESVTGKVNDNVTGIAEKSEKVSESVQKARDEWERFIDNYERSKISESQKIQIEFEAKKIDLAQAFSGNEYKAQLERLLVWKRDKERELERSLEAVRDSGRERYYNKVKFDDESYYQWKIDRIRLQTEQEYHELINSGMSKVEAERITTDLANEAKKDLNTEYFQYVRNQLMIMAQDEDLNLEDRKNLVRQFYDENKQAMINAGLSEEQIWSEHLQTISDMERSHYSQRISQTASFGGRLVNELGSIISATQQITQNRIRAEIDGLKETSRYQKANTEEKKKLEEQIAKKYKEQTKRLWRLQRIASIGQVMFNTAEAIAKAWAKSPLTFGMPWSGLAGAMGAMQVGVIRSQPRPYARGGLVAGNEQLIRVNERGQEYVLNANATRILGAGLLDQLNNSPERFARGVALPGGGSLSVELDLDPLVKKLNDIDNRIRDIELRVEFDRKELALIVERGMNDLQMVRVK